jgi:hypothetical protein
MLSRAIFRQLEERFGSHSVNLFASGSNNRCAKFYFLHWCRETSDVNAFAFDWGGESAWTNCPYRLLGRVWRKMESDAFTATLLVPLWVSAPRWPLLVPDAIRFIEAVVDWVWLPKMEPSLFEPGVGSNGKDIVPPD